MHLGETVSWVKLEESCDSLCLAPVVPSKKWLCLEDWVSYPDKRKCGGRSSGNVSTGREGAVLWAAVRSRLQALICGGCSRASSNEQQVRWRFWQSHWQLLRAQSQTAASAWARAQQEGAASWLYPWEHMGCFTDRTMVVCGWGQLKEGWGLAILPMKDIRLSNLGLDF